MAGGDRASPQEGGEPPDDTLNTGAGRGAMPPLDPDDEFRAIQRRKHDMTLFGKVSVIGTALGVVAVFVTTTT